MEKTFSHLLSAILADPEEELNRLALADLMEEGGCGDAAHLRAPGWWKLDRGTLVWRPFDAPPRPDVRVGEVGDILCETCRYGLADFRRLESKRWTCVWCTIVATSVSYDFPTDGPWTESVTLMGQPPKPSG